MPNYVRIYFSPDPKLHFIWPLSERTARPTPRLCPRILDGKYYILYLGRNIDLIYSRGRANSTVERGRMKCNLGLGEKYDPVVLIILIITTPWNYDPSTFFYDLKLLFGESRFVIVGRNDEKKKFFDSCLMRHSTYSYRKHKCVISAIILLRTNKTGVQ